MKTKKKKMILCLISEPVFDTKILLLADCTYKEASDRLHMIYPDYPLLLKEDEEDPQNYGCYAYRDGKNGKRLRVLWINDSKDVATLAHECLHAVAEVMRARDLTIDGAEEAYARYMDFLFITCYRRLVLKKPFKAKMKA